MNLNFEESQEYEMLSIFSYYDFPLIYIDKSPTGQLFLNYFIGDIVDVQGKSINNWFIAEITEEEYSKLENKKISFLKLLTELKELGRLYTLSLSFKDELVHAEYNLVTEDNFFEDEFPNHDYFVEYDYHTGKKY